MGDKGIRDQRLMELWGLAEFVVKLNMEEVVVGDQRHEGEKESQARGRQGAADLFTCQLCTLIGQIFI